MGWERAWVVNLIKMSGIIQISSVALIILTALYGAGHLLRTAAPDFEKLSPYESGFEPFGDARMKFSI